MAIAKFRIGEEVRVVKTEWENLFGKIVTIEKCERRGTGFVYATKGAWLTAWWDEDQFETI